MKTTTAALLFTAALTLPARARIGETQAQLTARYGQPVVEASRALLFEKNGFKILASMMDGKCFRILYTKEDEITPAEVKTLLSANSGPGVTWADQDGTTTKFVDESPLTPYITSDKRLEAFHHFKTLAVWHVLAQEKATRQAKADAEAKRAQALTGF